MSGIKHDQEKPDMSLLSSIGITKIAQVMSFGKKKYTANNWRGGIAYSRLLAAALRHTFSYLGGESKDPETGISHLAHACCCLIMVLEFEETRPDLDDRYQQPSKIVTHRYSDHEDIAKHVMDIHSETLKKLAEYEELEKLSSEESAKSLVGHGQASSSSSIFEVYGKKKPNFGEQS